MKLLSALPVVMALALGSSGCGRSPVSATSPETSAATTHLSGAAGASQGSASHVEGRIGPGALYAFDRPAEWNGDLVVYVHGYVPPAAPVALPNIGPLRDLLLDLGYAVATTSFSENGYAVPQAVRQVHQLRGLFASRFGHPARTYLLGQSLGGIIGLRLLETFPTHYDGALLVCGVVGGSRAEINYIGDVRVLFDYFYPGCLPGGVTDVPPGVPFEPDMVAKLVQTIGADPQGFGAMLQLDPVRQRLPFANPTEAVQSLITVLGFQWIGGNDLLDRTHGHQLYDNRDVVYSGDLPAPLLEHLNANVARYRATPDANAFLDHYYEPSGNLRVPVLLLHTSRDPVVPVFHPARYATRVAHRGRSDWLLARQVTRYGHCAFSPEELAAAFADLAAWVRSGVKPPA